ncbi:Transcriptional regulator, LysR family [Pseudomonas chlororaphis]|nr:Transcriptional regulator, LysR family [Pseudomonas chlororaphis]
MPLSPAGEPFALSCRQILEQTEAAERAATGVHACSSGQLTLALPMEHQVLTPSPSIGCAAPATLSKDGIMDCPAW